MPSRKPKLLSERDTNILTGKALVGRMTKADQLALCDHLSLLYFRMDEMDDDDFFGTEGWRHYFRIPDAE